ncbi:MAG: hypothetical protein HY682_00525 [Chloroflexi bacterium]|nr:hypothetical protein [Chloroflexota bacterium]
MGATWVTNITHFPPPDESLPDGYAPARRIAAYFGAIVAAASLAPAEGVVETGLRCRRRPGRRPCPGSIDLSLDPQSRVVWQCTSCDDNGLISNWMGSYWDLSRFAVHAHSGDDVCQVELSSDEYQAVRTILAWDAEQDAVLAAARRSPNGVRLSARPEEMEELRDCIASEANDRPPGRRRRLLDSALDRIKAVLSGPRLVRRCQRSEK